MADFGGSALRRGHYTPRFTQIFIQVLLAAMFGFGAIAAEQGDDLFVKPADTPVSAPADPEQDQFLTPAAKQSAKENGEPKVAAKSNKNAVSQYAKSSKNSQKESKELKLVSKATREAADEFLPPSAQPANTQPVAHKEVKLEETKSVAVQPAIRPGAEKNEFLQPVDPLSIKSEKPGSIGSGEEKGERTAKPVPVSVPGPETPINIADQPPEKPQPTAAGDEKTAGADKLSEKEATELIESGFGVANPEGALKFFKGKKKEDLTFPNAVKAAIQRNLAIRFQKNNYEKTDDQIIQAKAVFDPVLNVNLTGSQFDSNDRREFLRRKRLSFELLDAGFKNDTLIAQDDIVNEFSPDAFGTVGAFDTPSSRSRSRSQDIATALTQQIPWGSSFSAILNSTRNSQIFSSSVTATDTPNSVYVNNGLPLPNVHPFQQLGVAPPPANNKGVDPNGNIHQPIFFQAKRVSSSASQLGKGALNWVSTFNVNLQVPLPHMKDFGPYGPTEVPIKFAKITQQRAYWTLQSVINSTMVSVNNSYWELVRTTRRLEVAVKNRKNVEEIAKQGEDLLKLNRSTAYEKSQVDASVANLRGVEQGAWTNYIAASNTLVNILYYEKEQVLLPAGYAEMLGGATIETPDQAHQSALENNPDLQGAKVDRDFAQVALKFANNQSRPDLKLVVGINFVQSSSNGLSGGLPTGFGYNDLGPSIKHIFSPDIRDSFVGLNFRMPWGNRAFEAELGKAEETYTQSEKTVTQTANSVEQSVDNGLEALESARQQLENAKSNVDIAEKVYGNVVDLWSKGLVPPLAANKSYPAFEVITKNNDLLQARFRYIDGQIKLKQAEGQLLGAQGMLAAHFSEVFKISITPTEPLYEDNGKHDDKVKHDDNGKQDKAKEDEKEPGKETKELKVAQPRKSLGKSVFDYLFSKEDARAADRAKLEAAAAAAEKPAAPETKNTAEDKTVPEGEKAASKDEKAAGTDEKIEVKTDTTAASGDKALAKDEKTATAAATDEKIEIKTEKPAGADDKAAAPVAPANGKTAVQDDKK